MIDMLKYKAGDMLIELIAPLRNLYLMLRYHCMIDPFAKIGFNTRIGRGAQIGRVKFLTFNGEGTIMIGENTWISDGCMFSAHTGSFICIGEDCLFAMNTAIFTLTHEYMDAKTKIKDQTKIVEGVLTGSDVWIGYGCVIMPGVYISQGAVVGAMSKVTEDVLAYDVVTGNPAIKIKSRIKNRQAVRVGLIGRKRRKSFRWW